MLFLLEKAITGKKMYLNIRKLWKLLQEYKAINDFRKEGGKSANEKQNRKKE